MSGQLYIACALVLLALSSQVDAQSSVLNALQGGATDGADDTGPFQAGLSGNNGGSQVSTFQTEIQAAAPSVKENVTQSLAAYGINAQAPAPQVRDQLTSLDPADQNNLLGELTGAFAKAPSPSAGASSSLSDPTVAGGSASGSRRFMKL